MNTDIVSEFIGKGVFETLRAYNERIFKFQEHLQRFEQSAKALKLLLPPLKKIKEKILKEFKKSGFKDAYVRVSFFSDFQCGIPNVKQRDKGNDLIIIVKPLPAYPEKYYKNGVGILTVPTQRNIPNALDAKIKCNNFLSGVMAKLESGNAFEAVLLNKDGYVTEGTVSNIFVARRFCLITSPSYLGVLEGITRKVVMEIAEKLGIPIEEKPFTRYNLYTAEECFLTNTTMEIMPVTKIDGRIIGNGKPGPLTTHIRQAFVDLTIISKPR